MTTQPDTIDRKSLREQVEQLLPNWRSWYPSLFDAAYDLGLIRARVCSPSSLLLSSRHAAVQSEAIEAFRKHWSVEDDTQPEPPPWQRIVQKTHKKKEKS
jgi:hypothetical protein